MGTEDRATSALIARLIPDQTTPCFRFFKAYLLSALSMIDDIKNESISAKWCLDLHILPVFLIVMLYLAPIFGVPSIE